jgi:hypothetical protein
LSVAALHSSSHSPPMSWFHSAGNHKTNTNTSTPMDSTS